MRFRGDLIHWAPAFGPAESVELSDQWMLFLAIDPSIVKADNAKQMHSFLP
jgi:hypothetical protein